MGLLARPPPAVAFPSPLKRNSRPAAMAGAPSACSSSPPGGRKLPVLLFDIMDTVVRDPFYEDVPAFFRFAPRSPYFDHDRWIHVLRSVSVKTDAMEFLQHTAVRQMSRYLPFLSCSIGNRCEFADSFCLPVMKYGREAGEYSKKNSLPVESCIFLSQNWQVILNNLEPSRCLRVIAFSA